MFKYYCTYITYIVVKIFIVNIIIAIFAVCFHKITVFIIAYMFKIINKILKFLDI